MEMVAAPVELLRDLAALNLPPEREARLAELSTRRQFDQLTSVEELEFQAWACLRDQFAYLSKNARRLLGEDLN